MSDRWPRSCKGTGSPDQGNTATHGLCYMPGFAGIVLCLSQESVRPIWAGICPIFI